MRTPVCCFLGHVDAGKTTLSDSLRRTKNQSKEFGGITQQLGVTNFKKDYLESITKSEIPIDNLLQIDTPGHDCFTALRTKGAIASDIAIIVVDIFKGIEKHTLEVIETLKKHKKIFLIVANKIDKISNWNSDNSEHISLKASMDKQSKKTLKELNNLLDKIVLQFNEIGLNAAPYYKNPDPKIYASIVPVSGFKSIGVSDLIKLISHMAAKYMKNRLKESEFNRGYIIDKYKDSSSGYLLNVLLLDGKIKKGDKIFTVNTEQKTDKIKDIFCPENAKEMKGTTNFNSVKEINASQAIMIRVNNPECVTTGTEFYVESEENEDKLKQIEEIMKLKHDEIKNEIESRKFDKKGVLICSQYYAPIDSLIDMCKHNNIPVSGCVVGNLTKTDILKLHTRHKKKEDIQKNHSGMCYTEYKVDSLNNTVLCFQYEPDKNIKQVMKENDVSYISESIIYRLFEKYNDYREKTYQELRDKYTGACVDFKLKIIPKYVFRDKDPIVMGVKVLEGKIKKSRVQTKTSKGVIDLGKITSIELNRKQVDSADKNQEVCIKMELEDLMRRVQYKTHFNENDIIEPIYENDDLKIRECYPHIYCKEQKN